MSVTLLFVLVSWIAIIPCPTRAQDGGRELYFPTHYFYAEKHLVNHLIKTMIVKDLDECEYRCYLDANCVSLNIRNKYTNGTHKCELNNSTHLEDEGNLKHNQLYYYRAADHKCRKRNRPECKNNSTCQSGFTQKGYRCFCAAGFEGEHCENDTDECAKGSYECHENATCINTEGGYYCSCNDGYTGDGQNCTDIDDCASHPCKNEGTCVDQVNGFTCSCAEGFNGRQCETVVCPKYINLTDADRKYGPDTTGSPKCDAELNGWYRFHGGAGRKMMTTCPSKDKCGGRFSAWLKGDHPTVAQGSVNKKVCIRKLVNPGADCCDNFYFAHVRNCGSYFIYNLLRDSFSCDFRYCGTD